MADPDEPFTARTFGQAIELEKQWQVKRSEQEAVAAARAAQRDRAMAPLREVVAAHVARREIVSPDEAYGITAQTSAAKQAGPDRDPTTFVVTVAIDNLGNEDIVALQGSLKAKDRDNYLPLDLCWIDTSEQQRIPAHGHTEIRCGNPNRHIDANERAFVENRSGRFTEVWEPRSVRFASGRTFQSGL
ncbi:MAG TPA: hypothetical protein VGQ93_08405 [Lysobacter sp.]|nr:hypothetical protein [Lysobacter sp.]